MPKNSSTLPFYFLKHIPCQRLFLYSALFFCNFKKDKSELCPGTLLYCTRHFLVHTLCWNAANLLAVKIDKLEFSFTTTYTTSELLTKN